MDLRELRSFVHVARAGSFSRAASDLYIAQPALSRQIAKLETDIGVPLLVRHGRGVRLTAAGARLLERAELIIHMVSETGEQVRASSDEDRGHLAVGLPPTIGMLIGAELIRDFRTLWPRVSLHMREGLSSSLQEWVLDKRVDLAVVYNQPLLDSFDVRPLFSEPMFLVGPPGAQSARREYQVRDLGDIPLILPGLPHSNRRLIEQAAIQHGVRLRVELEVDSVALTKQLVKSGAGYSILTYIAIQQEAARGELTALSIERPAIRSTVAITTLRESRPSRLVNAWSTLLQEKLRGLTSSDAWKSDVVWLQGRDPTDPGR
ncbi:LysR family transcriptional regulator [Paraburkholderia domus]|uniref:HTH-type transcriptional regulator GltC n=1 Tax=Paraburkholderia domus TaxID=2793075 RepID=A0A9N8MSW6_9BURK|nr:LysR substrate-binding domain-containing protein [Paraburkholderia domus]MBK5166060.1 LysR family transcriptional regulator [Burkholderia sp. R-70211]CAE6900604.1 HTH-type transcriptional regulator GltC [Paraburkholderia domus]